MIETKTRTKVEFEKAIDAFICQSVDSRPAKFHETKLGKRKHGDDDKEAVDELLYFFYKSLIERKLMDMWMEKKVLRANQWRVDKINGEINEILALEDVGPPLLKAKKAASDLLRVMSAELYTHLFSA